MKMTTNRKLILRALSDSDGYDMPPYSAGDIIQQFKDALECSWLGYDGLRKVPSKQQVHRTLKELWHDGLIVGTRVKEEPYGNAGLPSWVVRYQLSSEVERNYLVTRCAEVHRKVRIAKHGSNLFGAIFDMGLPPTQVTTLTLEVKRLLQKTHPDKAIGLDTQFKQMVQCRDWIKSGIPLPTSTHTSGAGVEQRTLR